MLFSIFKESLSRKTRTAILYASPIFLLLAHISKATTFPHPLQAESHPGSPLADGRTSTGGARVVVLLPLPSLSDRRKKLPQCSHGRRCHGTMKTAAGAHNGHVQVSVVDEYNVCTEDALLADAALHAKGKGRHHHKLEEGHRREFEEGSSPPRA